MKLAVSFSTTSLPSRITFCSAFDSRMGYVKSYGEPLQLSIFENFGQQNYFSSNMLVVIFNPKNSFSTIHGQNIMSNSLDFIYHNCVRTAHLQLIG